MFESSIIRSPSFCWEPPSKANSWQQHPNGPHTPPMFASFLGSIKYHPYFFWMKSITSVGKTLLLVGQIHIFLWVPSCPLWSPRPTQVLPAWGTLSVLAPTATPRSSGRRRTRTAGGWRSTRCWWQPSISTCRRWVRKFLTWTNHMDVW